MNDILNLFRVLWRYRVSLTVIGAVAGLTGVAVALLLPVTFRAQTVLSPVESSSSSAGSALMSQLSGLPGLSSLGISAGASGVEDHIAYLSSRSFTEDFIRDNDLVDIINENEEYASPEAAMWPAYKKFNLEIRRILRDPITGLVTLTIEWSDPATSAEWANLYVAKANENLRKQALDRAERNIAFANDQLEKTTVMELQQSVYRLIEAEIRTAMLAQGQEDFAFRVLDRALPPGEKYRPRRGMTVVLFGLLGGFLGLLFVVISELRQLAKSDQSSNPQG